MKHTLNLFILPLLAGCIVCASLHTFIPYSGLCGPDQLSNTGTDIVFGLLGFLFGFLPCFIYGMAVNTLSALRPVECEAVNEVEQDINIYIGQIITSAGSNCGLRVKALKVRNILEYDNELLADYL